MIRESAAIPAHSLIFATVESFRFVPVSTCATVTAVEDKIKLIVSTTPLAARNFKTFCA